MSIFKFLMSQNGMNIIACVTVILFGIFLWVARNKNKRIKWTIRIVFACAFILIAVCKIYMRYTF